MLGSRLMSDTIGRDEFKILQDRVSVVEREVDGEKMVSRHILKQVRANGDDIAAVKTRLERVETRLDGVESEVCAVKTDLAQFRKDMPSIVAGAMREVLKESRKTGEAT
jgi:tetrahydromethanopterin S-methyltransferase subunit G